ncbi:hypothetical protein [Mucilaginibacter phyllosphaerae]
MLKKIWAWIIGATSKIKQALTFGKDVANAVKAVSDSTLLDILVTLTPNNIDNAALASWRAYINTLIKKMNWADKKLSEADEEEKMIILHTLAAVSAYWCSQKDGTGLNLQTTLSTSQIVYDKDNVKLSAV